MTKKSRAIFTQGSVPLIMFKYGLAMLPGTLSMAGYNIADTYFVGQLGREPLAAMGYTFPVIMLVGCLFHGLGLGVVTPASQAVGGEQPLKTSTIVTSGVALILLVSTTLALCGIFGSSYIYPMFGAKGDVLALVNDYMNVWFLGCATAAFGMSCNNLLITLGTPKLASCIMVAGMLLNVALDPLFILGGFGITAYGIKGAAIATVISQSTTAIAGLSILRYHHHVLNFEIIPWRKLKVAWGVIVRYAIPAAIGMLLVPAGISVMTRITAEFGDVAVAASAAASRMEMVAFTVPMALGMTMIPMVSQNFGARLYSRIRWCFRFSMGFAIVYLSIVSVVYFFIAPKIAGFFSDDLEVQEVMISYLRIVSWGLAAMEIHRHSGSFFTGCGHTRVAAYLNALRILVFLIPFSLLALYLRSLDGLFVSRLLADVFAGGIGLFLAGRMVHRLPQDGETPPITK